MEKVPWDVGRGRGCHGSWFWVWGKGKGDTQKTDHVAHDHFKDFRQGALRAHVGNARVNNFTYLIACQYFSYAEF